MSPRLALGSLTWRNFETLENFYFNKFNAISERNGEGGYPNIPFASEMFTDIY